MTTTVKIENVGHREVVVNVWESVSMADDGKTVERHDLKPGDTTPEITIHSWRRGITILEMAAREDI